VEPSKHHGHAVSGERLFPRGTEQGISPGPRDAQRGVISKHSFSI
jgi:hypothetical protein